MPGNDLITLGMHIDCMHSCQTERDFMCIILKVSTTVYYGSFGCLAKIYKLMFYMLTLYIQNGAIIKGGKTFRGVHYFLVWNFFANST